MRIVSLAPSITETLFAIGCGDRIVGRTAYCDYPEAAESIPVVGGFADCGWETIVEKRPDLVIGMSLHRKVFSCPELSGIRTVIVDALPPYRAAETVRLLGVITGHEAEADACAERVESSIRTIQAAAARKRPLRVCYLCDVHCPNWNACTTARAVTGINCETVGRDHEGAMPEMIVADIVESGPDVLLIPEEHLQDAQEVLDTELLKNFMDRHHPEIRHFTSKRLARTGAGSADALLELYRALYDDTIPELV